MTEVGGLGTRLATYRKRLGFGSTRALSARTGGRISESVLQNIESGRKLDLSVSQLLEISRALGISPLLLLAPLETPFATLDLHGISEDLRCMTAAQFDAWVRGTGEVTAGRAPALMLRFEIDQIRALVRELEDWHMADQARHRNQLTDAATHERRPYSNLEALAQTQREARIDQLCDDVTDRVDLTWVRRPWRETSSDASR